MDFTISEAQTALGALTREILAGRKAVDGFDRPLWTDLATAGVLAAALPSSAEGEGYGLLEQCTILTEIGRAVAPVPYLFGIAAAASAVAHFGTGSQVERWAAPAGRGELVLTAALGSDPVRAEDLVLTGSRSAVPALVYSDVILVPAEVDGSTKVFLVEASDPGVSVEPQRIGGGAGDGWLSLDRVALSEDHVLGDDTVADWLLARATVGLCAAQLGVAERALELTAEYARTRVQFGKAIGGFQAVAQRLADAYIDVEGIRLTMWQAAFLLSAGMPCPTEVATAKFWAADAGHRVAHTAVHVHGGVGIDVEHPVHRYFLAAKYNEFTLGGATTQLLHIGRSLAV